MDGGTYDESCNRNVQNRIRHLSSDVGFYLKWEEDKGGYPRGCDAFDGEKMKLKFNNELKADWQWVNMGGKDRKAGCPKQDMPDGTRDKDGRSNKMWQTVEMYADNQEKWIKDFVKVWNKMDKNGCTELMKGPSWKWDHLSKK